MKIEISISDEQARSAFVRLADLGRDMSPLMKKAAGHLEAASDSAFEREADSFTGAPWVPLAPATIKQRVDLGLWPGKILDRRGASGLAGSVLSTFGTDFAEVSSDEQSAPFIQLGTSKMPARRFLGFSDETVDAIIGDAEQLLRETISG